MIKYRLVILTLCSLCSFSNLAQAIDLTEDGKWKLKTSIRLRFESDWNVFRANGDSRPTRERLRLAANTELQYHPTDELSLGVRIAIANANRSSYANIDLIDFQNNPIPANYVYADKWYVNYKTDHWWIWGGRNKIPFWVQNGFFWDNVSIPAGLAVGGSMHYDQHTLKFSLGHFATPDGKYNFNGQFTSMQVMDTFKAENWNTTGALGFFIFHGHEGGERNFIGDGSRDYKILMANFQYVKTLWGRPLKFGVDGFFNIENYSANSSDPYTALHHDDVLGGVLSVKYGSTSKSGDWLLSYAYAYIEALAVNGDFAQSDWSRYDPSSANMQGHDFLVSYTFSQYFTLAARTMLAERITSEERGNRFRLDFKFKF
ncbi:MAG: hypothetical protein Q9M50_01885 [Methylococcales bacterium]|nr:hypothetical protein [Methylococcales bacterium]